MNPFYITRGRGKYVVNVLLPAACGRPLVESGLEWNLSSELSIAGFINEQRITLGLQRAVSGLNSDLLELMFSSGPKLFFNFLSSDDSGNSLERL